QEPLYRNYTLNQRVEASNPFVTASVWAANAGESRPGLVAFGGLDLSETGDLTSLELVSPVDGLWAVESTFWLPAEGIEERSRRDRVPYDTWADQGFIQTTPGRSVEYEYVAKHLATLFQQRDVRKIAFDSWNIRHLLPRLVTPGLSDAFIGERFVEMRQGLITMSPAFRTLQP